MSEKLSQDFDRVIALLSLTDSTISEATGLIKQFVLRAPDAIQLASALAIGRNLPDQKVVFLCADIKLNNAAFNKGLTVIDPESDESITVLQNLRSDQEFAQEGK